MEHKLTESGQSSKWIIRRGVYTAGEFVRETAVLLEKIIVQLGPDQPRTSLARHILMDGPRSSLSHEGRKAKLPLSGWKSANPSETTRQALELSVFYMNMRANSTTKPQESHESLYTVLVSVINGFQQLWV